MSEMFSSDQGAKESNLDSLVGEGKKFATADDLAKGKQEADAFIEQLQGELKGVRTDLTTLEGASDKAKTVADLIKAVQESQQQAPGDDNQMSEEDLSKKIREIMQGVSETSTKAQNLDKGKTLVLKKVDGDIEAAKTFLAERAKQLSMTTDALTALSEISPDAFAKLIDVDPSTITKSIASLDALNAQTLDAATQQTDIDGHKTKAYYTALKKEMGIGKYWSDVKVQAAYFKDAEALGDRF